MKPEYNTVNTVPYSKPKKTYWIWDIQFPISNNWEFQDSVSLFFAVHQNGWMTRKRKGHIIINWRYTSLWILKMGDVAKGAKIFKTKCAQCHVVGAGNTIPHFLPWSSSVEILFLLHYVLLWMYDSWQYLLTLSKRRGTQARSKPSRSFWSPNWSSCWIFLFSSQC